MAFGDEHELEAGAKRVLLVFEDGTIIDAANPLPVDITSVVPERVKITDDTGSQNANVLDELWSALSSSQNGLIVRSATELEKRIISSMPDAVTAFAWLDAGTADERVDTVTVTSATWDSIYGGSRSYVKDFAYGGSSGGYYVNAITESVS